MDRGSKMFRKLGFVPIQMWLLAYTEAHRRSEQWLNLILIVAIHDLWTSEIFTTMRQQVSVPSRCLELVLYTGRQMHSFHAIVVRHFWHWQVISRTVPLQKEAASRKNAIALKSGAGAVFVTVLLAKTVPVAEICNILLPWKNRIVIQTLFISIQGHYTTVY